MDQKSTPEVNHPQRTSRLAETIVEENNDGMGMEAETSRPGQL